MFKTLFGKDCGKQKMSENDGRRSEKSKGGKIHSSLSTNLPQIMEDLRIFPTYQNRLVAR